MLMLFLWISVINFRACLFSKRASVKHSLSISILEEKERWKEPFFLLHAQIPHGLIEKGIFIASTDLANK